MPGFQVGDILANLGIDISGLKQAFDEAKKSAKTFSSEVKGAISGIATGAQQALGVDKITAAFARATQAAKDFQRQSRLAATSTPIGAAGIVPAVGEIGRSLQPEINKLRNDIQSIFAFRNRQQVAEEIGTSFRNLLGVFGDIGRAGVAAFSVIGKAVSFVATSVTGLIRSLLSLPTLLAGFGVFKLVERAAEVDDLTTAFDNLSKSIGAISQTFLPKLRTATRGTVSDLELMRVANNAIILGVAKDADAFAELAENARRLGQAVGRGPVEALNDLVTGIGRQSFRVLDNIGIIVRAGEAYDAYAKSIGKTVAQLTDSERRFAFQLAVQDQIRKKVAELGPEVLTVGTAFRRLSATISNVFSDIASSLVSARGLNILTGLVSSAKPELAAFAALVRNTIDTVVRTFADGFNRLRSGDLNIGKVFEQAVSGLTLIALRTLRAFFENLTDPLIGAAIELAKRIVTGFVSGFVGEAQKQLATVATRVDITIFGKSLKQIFTGLAPSQVGSTVATQAFTNLVNTINEATKTLSPEQVAPFRAAVKDFSDALSEIINASNKLADPAADNLKDIPLPDPTKLEQRTVALTNAINDSRISLERAITNPVSEEDQKKLSASILATAEGVRRAASQAGAAVKDEIGKFFDTITGEPGRAAKELEKNNESFVAALNDPLAGFRPIQTDKVVQPFADLVNKFVELRRNIIGVIPTDEVAALKQFAVVANIATGAVEFLAKGVRNLRKVFVGPSIDPEVFSNFTNQANEAIDKLRIERLTAGLGDAEKAVAEFDDRVQQLGPASDKQAEALERLRVALIGVAAGAEAAKGAAALEANVRDFGKSQGRIIAENAQRAINAIKFSPTFDPNDPETKENLDKLNKAVQAAVTAQETIQFRDLTKDLSTSVFGGIVDGFERGESAAKVWSGIVSDIFRKSMTRVIDSLTNVISKAFGDLFGSLGLGLGGADFATGLIGVGSAILVGLRNRRDQTVSDFAQSVNSSEAVRGVVAGPTNVAIARVGDSLKIAMQTTEQLLLRIATDIENGRGGGTATGGFFSVRTTPSTTT